MPFTLWPISSISSQLVRKIGIKFLCPIQQQFIDLGSIHTGDYILGNIRQLGVVKQRTGGVQLLGAEFEGIDINNNGAYPITISNIRFDMGTSTTGTEYNIQIPVLEQLYGDPTGVEHIINSPTNEVKLYPNPAEAGAPVTIECEGAAQVEIYNIGGAMVESVAIEGTTAIETANLNQGIYIVRVITENATSVGKLIIK